MARTPRNDVAIYTPSAMTAGLYDRARGRAGGAERQMVLLARALAERGRRVAHVVHAPQDLVSLSSDRLSLVYRAPYVGDRRGGGFREAARVWRALEAADARTVVLRTASPMLAVASLYCALHRRALIFSTANNYELTFETMAKRHHRQLLYRLGVRLADAIVVQSKEQLELARQAFSRSDTVVHIPSFVEIPGTSATSPEPATAFLWVGRLIGYKRPMHYVELAREVPEARFVMIPSPQGADPADVVELRNAAGEVPNLELLDPIPHAQLMELLARSVAVVNTSSLEGVPNAFLEAWVHGVPALTFEFDPDGVIARHDLGIAAEGSWEQFVAGARSLWRDRADRRAVASRVQQYALETHSPERVGALWDELLTAIAPR